MFIFKKGLSQKHQKFTEKGFGVSLYFAGIYYQSPESKFKLEHEFAHFIP